MRHSWWGHFRGWSWRIKNDSKWIWNRVWRWGSFKRNACV